MLVLTRGRGETIQVGDVKITIVRTARNYTRIGIDAPADKNIRRGELPEKSKEPDPCES